MQYVVNERSVTDAARGCRENINSSDVVVAWVVMVVTPLTFSKQLVVVGSAY